MRFIFLQWGIHRTFLSRWSFIYSCVCVFKPTIRGKNVNPVNDQASQFCFLFLWVKFSWSRWRLYKNLFNFILCINTEHTKTKNAVMLFEDTSSLHGRQFRSVDGWLMKMMVLERYMYECVLWVSVVSERVSWMMMHQKVVKHRVADKPVWERVRSVTFIFPTALSSFFHICWSLWFLVFC